MKNPWILLLVLALALTWGRCSGGGGGDDGDDPDVPVSVDIAEASVTIEVGGTVQFHYSVLHASDTSVTWKVNEITGGNATIGTISPAGLYTAPAAIPNPSQVTVKAVANADTAKSDTATVTILPASTLTISPPSATVPAGTTWQFTSSSGATWEVIGPSGTEAATWGSISASGLYEAPAVPPWTGQVTVKATSTSDSSKTATATVTVVFSNASLSGHYVFRYRTADAPSAGTGGRLWAVGSFEADGDGTISGGSADFVNLASGGNGTLTVAFSGTYDVGPDGRAEAQFVLNTTGSPVLPMRWVLNSDISVRIVAFDDTGSGWGNIDRQDPSAFGSGLNGTYVFVLDGLVAPHRPLSAAGMFDVAAGTIDSGRMDINDNGAVTAGAAVAGACSAIDPATGRGTWTVTAGGRPFQFVFYALSTSVCVFGSRADDEGFLGSMIRQDRSAAYSNSSLAGVLVFVSTGYARATPDSGIPAVSAGRVTADGQGNLTNGAVDSISGGVGAVNAAASGTYAIAADGHGTMGLVVAGGLNNLAIYMIAARQCFYVSLMPTVSSTGQFLPQESGAFDTTSLRSAFALTTRGTFVDAGNDLVAQMTLNGTGGVTGIADANYAGVLAPATALTGVYTVASNGRGEITLNAGQAAGAYAIYVLSRRTAFLVPIGGGAPTAVGYAYRQY